MRGHVRKHGTGWQYTVDLEPDSVTGKRRQKSKGGFKTKKDCEKGISNLNSCYPLGRKFSLLFNFSTIKASTKILVRSAFT